MRLPKYLRTEDIKQCLNILSKREQIEDLINIDCRILRRQFLQENADMFRAIENEYLQSLSLTNYDVLKYGRKNKKNGNKLRKLSYKTKIIDEANDQAKKLTSTRTEGDSAEEVSRSSQVGC